LRLLDRICRRYHTCNTAATYQASKTKEIPYNPEIANTPGNVPNPLRKLFKLVPASS
jgi:hypothetical protein